MEGLLGELHHFMASSPGVQTAVHDEWGKPVCHVCHVGGCIVDAFVAIDETHAFAHQFLFFVGSAKFVELLSPFVDLVTQVYLYRAKALATQTQGAGRHVSGMFVWIAQHAQVDADGARDEVAVAVTSATAIYRACVHT